MINKAVNNMYLFIDGTWNPIKGLCPFLCVYCYMLAIFKRFKQNTTMRLEQKELQTKIGSGKFIFVGSSTDMWSYPVESAWIVQVLDHCLSYPDNKYLFQSKSPQRFLDFLNHPLMSALKEQLVFATTIETNRDISAFSKADSIEERVAAMTRLRELGYQVMITVEPVMQFDFAELVAMLRQIEPCQVNIGSNSNKAVKLPEPTRDELVALVEELKTFTNVHLKSNSDRILGELNTNN